jgi:plastocyanin
MPAPTASCSLYLFLASIPALALAGTNHVVTANPDFTFTPDQLTINQGDTVTFQNGGGVHNVAAISGPTTFRCANGCDGADGNGNLAGNTWSATVTFPTAGETVFFCEAHGSANGTGMAGVITINIPVELQSFEIE